MSAARRRALIALPALLLALAWWQLVWGGRTADVEAAEEATAAARQRAASVTAQVRAARELEASGESGRIRLSTLQAALPSEPDVAGLLREHAELAARTGVTVVSISPQEPEKEPRRSSSAARRRAQASGPTQLPVAIRVTGPSAAVDAYLEGLRTLPRATSILDLGLTDEGAGRTSLEVRLAAFIDD